MLLCVVLSADLVMVDISALVDVREVLMLPVDDKTVVDSVVTIAELLSKIISDDLDILVLVLVLVAAVDCILSSTPNKSKQNY